MSSDPPSDSFSLTAALSAFAQTRGRQEMIAFWQAIPAGQEEGFMQAVQAAIAQAEQAGGADAAQSLAARLEDFRQIHEAANQVAEMPPTAQAVIAFIQAEDDAAAAALFAQQRALLQPYEAQQMMDALVAQAPADTPAEVRERLASRYVLLRQLRGAAPTPAPTAALQFPISNPQGNLYQAGRDQHFFSAHAESGGVATVVNNLFIQSLERRWQPPQPQAFDARFLVDRPQEMDAVREALAQEGRVAVTGQTSFVAVQGMAGVGKTVLARLLAQNPGDAYPDGVIWEELGPDFTAPEQAQAILRRWAGYAAGFFGLPENLQQIFVFEPDAVRYLLAERPRLLVVLDNVWSLAAIQPLRNALPPGSHLLITTRSQEIARGLGGGQVEVGRLSEAEAIELCARRLNWRPDPAQRQGAHAWIFALLAGIERHALGLDVALGVLRREGGDQRSEWQAAAARLLAAIRGGDLGDLTQADDLSRNVQVVLLYSVRALDQESQGRFRRLGSFAPEAPFTTADAAQVWGCDQESARRSLTLFANAALLERQPDGGGWRQHALLRGVALSLLSQAGEGDAAAAAHARAYGDAMAAADDEQRYYQMLPALPQLRHAFDWAAANDLELALSIAENCVNLHAQFGLARQAAAWSERLLTAAQTGRANKRALGRVSLFRGTSLIRLASLPGEDRGARLRQALAAYDEALALRRDVPLDYATTQNNRAVLLSDLASLPGEDRGARLTQALRCAAEAVFLFDQLQHVQYLEVGRRVLAGLRRACGDGFAALWAAAGLGAPPDWLLETEDDDASPSMRDLLTVFAQIENQDRMIAFWQAMPTAMEAPFMQAVETRIVQAEQTGDQETVKMLRSRLEGFRAICAGAARAIAAREPLLALLQEYQEALQAADAENPQVAEWQAITALGERLLAMQAGAESLLNWNALREQLASNYNTLADAHDRAGDKAASLAAFERAIALQPDFAMFHRNRAGALIELGRLDAARAALDQARALQPDAPRLADLEAALAKAQEGAGK